MALIKNKLYKEFMNGNFIKTLSDEDIIKALNNVKGKHAQSGRSLIIMLHYTGARPAEVLALKAKDVYKEGKYILVRIIGVKRGNPRTLALPYNRPLIKELWKHIESTFPEFYLYEPFRSSYKRKLIGKHGDTILKEEVSNKLRYYFKIWFEGVTEEPIPPYYLRHNRLSKLSYKGASIADLKAWKGSKTVSSIDPYLHMSTAQGKKLSRLL